MTSPKTKTRTRISLTVCSISLLLLTGCGEHEGAFDFSGTACGYLECTMATQSISEQDHGYIIALDTPDSIGLDYYDDEGTLYHNCVILYRTHYRFFSGDKVSGRMYLDEDYSKSICAYHYHLGLPEGVCTKLD